MKIFAVYTNLNLTRKPEWLDRFRQKYDKPYDFHVTLKQPCYIEEEKIPELKKKLADLLESTKTLNPKIEVVFNEIMSDKSEDGVTVMLKARDNHVLESLQRDLYTLLQEYNNYVKPKYKNYEENFKPHITIARNLTEQQYNEVKEYLIKDYECIGEIIDLTLSVVNEVTLEEAKNVANQTIYQF